MTKIKEALIAVELWDEDAVIARVETLIDLPDRPINQRKFNEACQRAVSNMNEHLKNNLDNQ